MDTILVAGIDSVVGANFAAVLADRCRVAGLSFSQPVSIENCETAVCPEEDADAVRSWLAAVRPEQIVYCGFAGRSPWQQIVEPISEERAVETARTWAAAARESGTRLTLISSDAVFTGPWMFHKEDSNCRCDSPQARAISAIEQVTARHCPDALIVRTQAFGWAPGALQPGWIEDLVAELEAQTAGPFDYLRHATPILATDLLEIVEKAWQAGLGGIYHVAGAERINPNQFVRRLADEFGLPGPEPVDGNCLFERPTGFGRGETSLHTVKIRKALDVSMPNIAGGLNRLREQRHNGHFDRLQGSSPVVHERAA